MLLSCADFHAASFVSCSIASCRVGEASRFALVSRRSKAGRFAYNLRVPRTPTRRYADTALWWSRLRRAVKSAESVVSPEISESDFIFEKRFVIALERT